MNSLKFNYWFEKPDVEIQMLAEAKIIFEKKWNKYYKNWIEEINETHGEMNCYAYYTLGDYTINAKLIVPLELKKKIAKSGLPVY